MNLRHVSPTLRFGLATLFPLIACAIQWTFWAAFQPFVWFLFYPAVFLSSWLGGLPGGLVSTVVSEALVIYVFIPPQFDWQIARPENLFSVASFLVMGILFSFTFHRLHQAHQKLTNALDATQQANRQLQEANQKITRLYDQLRELDELKSQFFANVSHELRTPLTLILGSLAKSIKTEPLAENVRHDLEIVDRNARLLYRHVTDLLDASKMDAGKMQLAYTSVDLAHLTRFVISHFEVLAAEKQTRLAVQIPPNLPAQVDSAKCQRVLLNLLSNAFKFTPDGGSIHLTLYEQVKCAVWEIHDSGPGVPPNMRDAIFERFRQLNGGAARQHGGTGLGLSIAKEFVTLHGGHIEVVDTPGGGACFRVTLPLEAPSDGLIQNKVDPLDPEVNRQIIEELHHTPIPSLESTASRHAPLVLVVEDNAEMTAFIANILTPSYRLVTASNGQAGLTKALETHPDLILSDVMMPQMSGDQMVSALRHHAEMQAVPILMLTAKADEKLRVHMLREGVQEYLLKPFDADELLARVDNLIKCYKQNEQTNARLAAIIESSDDAIISKTLAGVITSWNQGAERLFGYTAAEVVGQPITLLFPGDRLNEEIEILSRLMRGDHLTHFETVRVHKDGHLIDISATISPIRDRTEVIIGISKIARDITERKRTERELRASQKRNHTLLEAIPDTMFRLHGDGTFLDYKVAKESDLYAPPDAFLGKKVSDVLPPRVASQCMLAIERAVNSQLLQTFEYTLPLQGENLDFEARVVADETGDTIFIVRNVTARKQMENALHESHTRYQTLFEHSPDGIVILNPGTGQFIEFNGQACQHLGYTRDEFSHLSLTDIEVAETHEESLRHIQNIIRQGRDDFDTRHRTKQGEIRDIHVTAQYVQIQGKAIYHCIWRDITERKQAEKARLDAEQKYRRLVENMPDIVYVFSSRRGGLYYSPYTAVVLGYSLDYLYTHPFIWNESIHPDDRPVIAHAIESSANSQPFQVEYRLRDAHGNWHWLYDRSISRYSQGEETFIEGLVTDITERKRGEEMLRESEERFTKVFNCSPIPVAIRRLSDDMLLNWNPAFEKLVGYAPEQLQGKKVGELGFYFNSAIRAKVLEKAMRRDSLSNMEIQIIRADQQVCDVLLSVEYLTLQGEACAIASFVEITERTRMEKALQLSERTVRQTAEKLRMVNQISLAITAGLEFEQIMQSLYLQCQQIGDTDLFFVAIYDDQIAMLNIQFIYQDGERGMNRVRNLKGNPGLGGYIVEHRQTLYIPDLFNLSPEYPPVTRQAGKQTRSFVGVPLIVHERMVGVLSMQSYSPDAYTPEQIYTLELLAPQVAIAIQNSQLYEQVEREEKLANALIDNLPGMICLVNQQRQLVRWNKYTEALLNFTPDGERNLDIFSIWPGVDQAQMTDLVDHFFAGEQVATEMQFTGNPAGRTVSVHTVGTRLPIGNEPHLLMMGTDITERKQREYELEAIAQVSAALRAAPTRADMLPVITCEVRKLVQAATVALIFFDDQVGEYTIEHVEGTWAHMQGRRLPSTAGILQTVLKSGKTYLTNDLPHDPHFVYREIIGELCTLMEIPLATSQAIIGFIAVAGYIPFSNQDVQVVEAISNIAANALHRVSLNERNEKYAAELKYAYDTTLEGWAHALELRDRETEGHTRRVTQITVDLSRAMGIDETELEHVRRGALLHDIGKMGIPDSILLKPGMLDEREWEIMRRHPEYAYQLLSPIVYLKPAIDIPYCHHEKWDGTGYPRHLVGEAIPLAARVFAVVDVWDALCSDRPYRLAWRKEQALEYISAQAGKHFDPTVVTEFLKLMD